MIGNMIAKIRTEKGFTKTELAKITGINIGHLTHIEKGDRNPSHKTLKIICQALDVPYQQLMYTYDKTINEEQEKYSIVNHISYNKILAIDNIKDFISCPSGFSSASLVIRCPDEAMSPLYKKDDYIFIEFNSPLNNKDVGLFSYNNDILIREFTIKQDSITLKAENKLFEDININNDNSFYIIGKVLGK